MSDITNEMLNKGADRPQLDQCNHLNLSNQGIKSITAVIQERCPCVQNLNLNHNELTKISNLSKLVQLQTLSLAFNEISSTIGIDTLQALITLNLSHNRLTQLTKLVNNKQLQTLNLSHNWLVSVDGIEGLRELRVLNLSGNQLKRIDFLIYNTKLQELFLSSNQLTQVNGKDFQNCPGITTLEVSHNQLTMSSFVNSLQNLEHLNMSHNQLTTFDCAKANDNMEFLDLSSNRLAAVSTVEYKYRQLTHLYVNDNEILTEFDMKFLHNMEQLIDVDFRENPFYNEDFETSIILECPWLELVNGREVGKPANFIMREIREIRDELQQQQIDIDRFTFSELNVEDNDVITEERFKAILKQQNIDPEEDAPKPVERSALLFNNEEEFHSFIDERNRDAVEIRQRYLSIMHRNKTEKSETQTDYGDHEDNTLQKEAEINRDIPSIQETPVRNTSSLAQLSEGRDKQKLIRKATKTQPRQSLPPAKASILKEISHLKQSVKNPDFQRQIGYNVTPPQATSKLLTSTQRMNQSSENFSQHKQQFSKKFSSFDKQGYQTMTTVSKRSSSINRPAPEQQQLKLPKIAQQK